VGPQTGVIAVEIHTAGKIIGGTTATDEQIVIVEHLTAGIPGGTILPRSAGRNAGRRTGAETDAQIALLRAILDPVLARGTDPVIGRQTAERLVAQVGRGTPFVVM
jgi:hypothetical protein